MHIDKKKCRLNCINKVEGHLMVKLSIYMVVYNEELRIERTLRALQGIADELIIVDSGSTDKTLEIAKRYHAKIYFHEWKSYCDQKHYAESLCTNEWVLLLDADEVISKELLEEIKAIKKSPQYKAYKIKIVDMLPKDTKASKYARQFNPVRLYSRKYGVMPADKMNKDRVELQEGIEIGQMKSFIYHYSFLNIEQTLDKYNRHSTELQKTWKKEGKKVGWFRLIIEYPWQFLHYYIGHRYIFRGKQGFIYASLLAYFRFLKVAKSFE